MILSTLIFCPILFALILIIWPSSKTLKHMALGLSLVEFFVGLVLLQKFDGTSVQLQMVEKFHWVERFGISYFVGVDGLSIWLVILTVFLTPLMILGAWNAIEEKVKGFLVSVFILQSALIGTFLAMDAILFYLFWELSLVPMYFLIGIWGGARRIYATVKFFIFTMAGSVLMLLAIIYLMFITEQSSGAMSASITEFYKLKIPFVGGSFWGIQSVLFFAFAIAFAIKVPVFPFHTWLPDAHVEAPTPGSVILAGVMLKMGTYGFLRWALPLFPEAVEYWSWLFILVGVIGIVYGALVAMVQPDIKKLVAYSSVSHMGYVLVGLFCVNETGITGALYQMLNHGISTSALFFMVGMIYERTHSREIAKYGGLAEKLPIFAIFFFIFTLSSIAVPLTNGFVGEFLILFGLFQVNQGFTYVAVTGVVLGAVYMLWMYKKVFFGKASEMVNDAKHPLHDLSLREIVVLAPLVILVFWMGILPGNFIDFTKPSIQHLVKNREQYQLSEYKPAAKDVSVAKAQK